MMAKSPRPWEANWIIGKELGSGGQGRTHLVTRKDDGEIKAAIKILKNKKSEQARRRMYREVVNLDVLSSRSDAVPKVIDHNTEHYADPSVELFAVMDYIPGETLSQIIKDRGCLPLDDATRIVMNICKTVDIAHNEEILHRDLKPDNIIVRDLESADVVIVDYGLSFNKEDLEVTQTNETFRNRFMDLPETNTPGGNRRDFRSDITSVCAIYYYLITGHIPGQLQDGNGLLPHVRPGYSLKETDNPLPNVEQFVIFFNRGFAPNVENRFQTVSEFYDRISQVAMSSSPPQLENTVEVASRASARIRKGNRKTQLAEFQKPALSVLQSFQQFTNSFVGKLPRFKLIFVNEPTLGQALPEDLDRVCPHQGRIQLSAEFHTQLKILLFAIGSRGEQCVVLKQKYEQIPPSQQPVLIEDFKQVIWYDATEVPDLRIVHDQIQNWLNVSIEELADALVN